MPETKNGKAGGSAGRRKAVQRRLPRARAAFLSGGVIRSDGLRGDESGIGVCLSRRPRAQRAGDGAASAAPSALPPTCIINKHTSYSQSLLFGHFLKGKIDFFCSLGSVCFCSGEKVDFCFRG